MLRSFVLPLAALLATGGDGAASPKFANGHGSCVLDTVSLDDGSNAFNTSCPIVERIALQQEVEALGVATSNATATQQKVDALEAQLRSARGRAPSA